MNRTTHLLGASLLAAALLAACGGGGDGGGFVFTPPPAATPPTQPPAMADSYEAFVAYVKGLIASAFDMAEPADVAAFDPPPTSDVKDPVATP